MPARLLRPEPLTRTDAQPVRGSTPPREAAERLVAGETLCVVDTYTTGQRILGALGGLLPAPAVDAGYPARRAHRARWRDASSRLLVRIERNALGLSDAPNIGYLTELYPDKRAFSLPYEDVQHLNAAWNLYGRGVHLAVLGHRVHPYWGTYVPERTSHLELFGTWLSQYDGARGLAVDVGTGCGVLALMLARAGFAAVVATDTNPNAVHSVQLDVARLDPRPPITAVQADLLGDDDASADVIVFNPPWMKGEVDSPLDKALYFEDASLFERFFDQALGRLGADGRVVLLFSSLIRLVQPDEPHPIEVELARGRFRLVQKLQRKVKPQKGRDGQTRRTRERVEVWELAHA